MKRALEEGLVLIAGAGLGLAAMYLLDSSSGSHRRAAISKATRHTLGGIGHSLSNVSDAVMHRATSAAESVRDTAHDLMPRQQSHCSTSSKIAAAAGGGVALFTIGAGFAYLLDPDRGRSRRAYLHDQIYSLIHRGGSWMEKKRRHLRNRAYGMYAQARTAASQADQPAGVR